MTTPPLRTRIAAGLELALVLVGVPAGVLAALGRHAVFRLPHPASLPTIRHALTGVPQPLVDSILHSLIWVLWILWAYCVAVVALSAAGQLSYSLSRGRPSRIFRLRNRVVPAPVRLVLDAVFVAALVTPHPRASTSIRDLPTTTVAQVVPSPGGSPAGTLTSHGPAEGAILLAQRSDTPPSPAYTVRPGDTLSGIAQEEYGSADAWPAIAHANAARVPDPNLIRPGQELEIPGECGTQNPVGSGVARVHVVQEGESLWSIAERYYGDGTKSADIFAANRGSVVGPYGERLERPRFIEAGWRLVIPPAGTNGVAPPAAGPTTVAPAVPAPATIPPVIPPVSQPVSPSPAPTPAQPGAGAAGPLGSPRSNAPGLPGQVSPGTPVTSPDPLPAPAARPERRGHSHGIPVHLPGGLLIPGSLAAALLALAVRAKARRLRDLHMDPEPIEVPPEGPVLTAIRKAGVAPSFDPLGPFSEAVLRAWAEAHDGEVPAIAGSWERQGETAFLLEMAGHATLPPAMEDAGFQIRFEESGGQVWAIGSGGDAGRLRRGIFAFGDGLLIPVGTDDQDAGLHLPLLGPPISIQGPNAGGLVEAMVLAARARCSPEDLRIIVVGAGEEALSIDLGDGDADLPAVRRIRLEEQEAARIELESELLHNATMLADYGLDDFSRQALDHPDDRLRATLVVLDAGIAGAWAPLLTRGRHLGLAGLVMGEWPAAERILRLDDEGLLHVDAPGLGAITLSPCLLSPQAMRELATVVVDEPTEPEELESSAPAEATAGPMGPATSTPPAVGSRVRLQLFGSMRVLNAAGEAVPQPGRGRRATREVLAYLGTHEGWVRKETLRNALWEGEDFKDATDELYAAVSEARRWLVDALAGGGEAIPGVSASGRSLILQKTGQGYRLATELVSVDVSEFEQAFAAAKAQPDSAEGLGPVIDAYRGNLLDYADNPEAFTWVEREGLRMVQQKKVAWASIALSEILRSQGHPDHALQILEPLLDNIVNDELWLQALLCEGEAPPRGLGARDRVMALWRRYESRLRDLGLYPSGGSEQIYKRLLSHTQLPMDDGEGRNKFVATDGTDRRGNRPADGDQRVVGGRSYGGVPAMGPHISEQRGPRLVKGRTPV